MVYNRMDLCGVPWETIIKEHRRSLLSQKFNSLEGYIDHFFEYLSSNELFFSNERQSIHIAQYLQAFFYPLKEKKLSKSDLASELDKNITEYKKLNYAVPFDASSNLTDCRAIIDSVINNLFLISHVRGLRRKFRELAELVLLREGADNRFTGVVFAGFGENDIFPKLVEYDVNLVISGKVKRKLKSRHPEDEGQDVSGKVLSFAQEDVTRTILEGINPQYADTLRDAAINFFSELPRKIIMEIDELNPAMKKHYLDASVEASRQAIMQFFISMERERLSKHIFPIESAIQLMPFSELAEVAEVFIGLTQVRRRLSPDSETVGGPIDVAVISKADGFVWTKRKFYFDKELNYSFFANYQN